MQNRAEYKENETGDCSQAGYKGEKTGKKTSRRVPVVRESRLRISCQGKEVQ